MKRKPPAALSDFQRWFARASSRPLLPDNATIPRGVDGPSLRVEANARLNTVNGLSGLERLEVYNRQYWFRLITILQDEYPCCQHVIGLDAFNTWVIRYLDAYPPVSPYLADMDASFASFLKRRYRGKDKDKVLEAAAYDKAFSRGFDTPAFPVRDVKPVKSGRTGGAPALPDPTTSLWVRAGHLTPLWLHWDFASYRALCREDEALTGRFPLRRREHGVCLHRHDNMLYEKPVSRAEFLLLDTLGAPRTLDKLFQAATRRAKPRERAAMERHAVEWFRAWTELGWIGAA